MEYRRCKFLELVIGTTVMSIFAYILFKDVFITMVASCLTVFFIGLLHLTDTVYIPCYVCKGYGAKNLKIWQKIINTLWQGAFGEKCPQCDGLGFVFTLDEIPEEEIKKLNSKYKKTFGENYHPFEKYLT